MIPAPTSGHPVGVSNDEFRTALSRLAAGVVLVTAFEAPLDPEDQFASLSSFGEDADGELYLISLDGVVYKLSRK